MTDYTGISTDDASQTGRGITDGKEVTHNIRVLLSGVHYLIPTIAAAKAGRRMTFFTPLQFFVLKNDKTPLWSLISALS